MSKQESDSAVENVEVEVLNAESEQTADPEFAEETEGASESAAAEAAPQAEEPAQPEREPEDDSFIFKMPQDKPTEAVGLSYHESDLAPIVASVGKGERAEAIVEMARELGIYIHRDPMLLNQLKQLKEGEQVPEELFTIIATILSFSYILQGKTPGIYRRADGSKAVNLKA